MNHGGERMWFFTKYGFFDAVQQDGVAEDELVVKGRVEDHLRWLVDFLPGHSTDAICYAPDRDYPYRLRVKKADFARAVEAMITEIDYPKFKPAAGQKCGERFHDMLLTVWGVVRGLQEGRSRFQKQMPERW